MLTQLLEYCGLPWSNHCLHFERNAATSATASSIQVRSPIYDTAIGRWRHYQQQLTPLRQLLEVSDIEVNG